MDIFLNTMSDTLSTRNHLGSISVRHPQCLVLALSILHKMFLHCVVFPHLIHSEAKEWLKQQVIIVFWLDTLPINSIISTYKLRPVAGNY